LLLLFNMEEKQISHSVLARTPMGRNETSQNLLGSRLNVIENKFNGVYPGSIASGVMAYVPQMLSKVLELEAIRALEDIETDHIEGLLDANVWPTEVNLNCTVLVADVSGFCKVSEELCSRGVEGLDVLRSNINGCFTQLIGTIQKYGGDILNFAGDALIIAWSDLSTADELIKAVQGAVEPSDILELNQDSSGSEIRSTACMIAAVLCGLELAKSEPLFDKKPLKIHLGLASGVLNFHVVGGQHKQFQYISLSPVFKEIGTAINLAEAKQLVISSSTQSVLHKYIDGKHLESGTFFLAEGLCSSAVSDIIEKLIHTETPKLVLEMGYNTITKALMFCPPPPEFDVIAPHPVFSAESEIRDVTVVFIKFGGARIESMLACDSKNKGILENIFSTCQKYILEFGAMLRQFLVDDKGMVMILALGVPSCVHLDNELRGVLCARRIGIALDRCGISTFSGVTAGKAYVGNVGNKRRCEYALVGDVVNLSARLMCFAERLHIESLEDTESKEPEFSGGPSVFGKLKLKSRRIVCCKPVYDLTTSQFEYALHENVKIKGKKDEDLFEVVNESKSQRDSTPVDSPCIGFEDAIDHISSLCKCRDVKNRIQVRTTSSKSDDEEEMKLSGRVNEIPENEEVEGDIPVISSGKFRRETSFLIGAPECSHKTSSLSIKGGTLVVVRSDEGSGKTTFLRNVCKMSIGMELIPIMCRLKPSDFYRPYSAIADMIRSFVYNPKVGAAADEIRADSSPYEIILEDWKQSLSVEEASILPRVQESVLQMSSWSIAGWSPGESSQGEPTDSHTLIKSILQKFFLTPFAKNMASNKALFAFDDIQNVDSCSWEVLMQLIGNPEILLLVVCTAVGGGNTTAELVPGAPEKMGTENSQDRPLKLKIHHLPNGAGQVHFVVLPRLLESEVTTLVGFHFPDNDWGAHDLKQIFDLSQGHPFLALEIARGIRLNQFNWDGLNTDDQGAVVRENNLIRVFTSRVDMLSNVEQRVLKAASAIGTDFNFGALSTIVPRKFLRIKEGTKTQLECIIDDLCESDFLSKMPIDSEDDKTLDRVYEFAHEKLRATCYNLLLRADQVMYHKQIALWISTKFRDDLRPYFVPLMSHLVKADDLDRAMDFAVGAIQNAVTSGAFSECKVILDEVLFFIKSRKIKYRTSRMIYTHLNHILDSHKTCEYSVVEKPHEMSKVLKGVFKTLLARNFTNASLDESFISESSKDFAEDEDPVPGTPKSLKSSERAFSVLGFTPNSPKASKKSSKNPFWTYFEYSVNFIKNFEETESDATEKQLVEIKSTNNQTVHTKSSSVCSIQ